MIGAFNCPRGVVLVFRLLKTLVLAGVMLAALLAAVAGYWLHRPLSLELPTDATVLDVVIAPGASALGVAQTLERSGVQTPYWLLYAWFRLSGQASFIKAGSYEIQAGTSPRALLDQLVQGRQATRRVTLVEGWNYRQVLQALKASDHLVYDLPEQPTAQDLAQALRLGSRHAEGRFFPDTYIYPKNASASSVLRQAAQAMEQQLQQAWAEREPNLPLRSAEEALILASIVEKETSLERDRPFVAGVFVNRLRLGMRLQTDPSVIYGLGPGFDLNLRRRDLEADTPYNTYTRAGLPPTPIAMPGKAALLATVKPAATSALYFVAKGDGSSHFSVTLNEHNQAVNRYILKR